LLLQVFKESNVNLNNRHVIQTVVLETQEKRAKIFTDLYTDRHSDLSSIRIFNDNLKKILMKRLKSLTS